MKNAGRFLPRCRAGVRFMPDDVILAKVETIERCLRRIGEEYAGTPAHLHDNWTRQDSILLNLERACQASIDLALRLVTLRGLGFPKESREAFELLATHHLLSRELADAMQRMVGFRNVAVHNYRKLDLAIVQNIIEHRLDEFSAFCRRGVELSD
jgi:uncharacterized protein YutE (UPF0331/DUF86 family)